MKEGRGRISVVGDTPPGVFVPRFYLGFAGPESCDGETPNATENPTVSMQRFVKNSGPLALAALAAAGSIGLLLWSFRPHFDEAEEWRKEFKAIDARLVGQNRGRAGEYDWVTSRANLAAIGKNLQVFRRQQGVKPVADRKEVRDAGLPPLLFQALSQPGKPWSTARIHFLSAVARDIKGELRMLRDPAGISHMTQLYESDRPAEAVWRTAGEKAPVLADLNMLSNPASDSGHVLVLLLDGTVQKRSYAKGKVGAVVSTVDDRGSSGSQADAR